MNAYIIAGEPSGDRLGGALMRSLSQRADVRFQGVGGEEMIAAGLESLFGMSDLTVMGLGEVLPRLPLILRRMRETVADIEQARPDVLITIDAPDFSLRVAARARKARPDLKVIHYVAPSVWAWRPGRAAKMARHVDHVLALLPFEPPYMRAAGMSCDFVGHPVAGAPQPSAEEISAFRAEYGITPEQKVLLLAPGSRRGEVRRLRDDFVQAVARLRQTIPDLAVLCPVAETVRAEVAEMLAEIGERCFPVHGAAAASQGAFDSKTLAFASADAALCASGTITLELAATDTPMAAAYRTTWLTSQIVRRVIRVNTANLVNLISGKSVVPEFLQEFSTPAALEQAVLPLLLDPDAAGLQRSAFDHVMDAMGRGGPPPADRAADSVLSVLSGAITKPDAQERATAALTPGPGERHHGRR
ncbi:MAG: lipid-A-disaccharide synthase [Pseudomonadota bacterium]